MSEEIPFATPTRGIVQLIDWVESPDGSNYKSIFGTLHVIPTEDLPIKPGSGSEKWLVVVTGSEANMVIPGCKIHSLLQTDDDSGRAVWSL